MVSASSLHDKTIASLSRGTCSLSFLSLSLSSSIRTTLTSLSPTTLPRTATLDAEATITVSFSAQALDVVGEGCRTVMRQSGTHATTVADYIKHLKTRLARGKTYNYYAVAISRIRMKQGQTVGEFYDKIRILLSGGRAAYRAKHNTDRPAGERQLDLAPFTNRLPTHMSETVEMLESATLGDAFKIAEKLAIREDRRKRQDISPSRVLYSNDSRLSYSERNSRPSYRECNTRPEHRDSVDYYSTRESRTQYREDRPRYSSYRDDGRRGSYRNKELSPYRYDESRSPSPAYQKTWQDHPSRDKSLSPKFSLKPNSILKPSGDKGENTNGGCGNKYCRCRCCPSRASVLRSPLPNHRQPLNYPEARRASPTTSRMTDLHTLNLGDEKKASLKFLQKSTPSSGRGPR